MTEDFFFNSAKELGEMLRNEFVDDHRKIYNTIETYTLQDLRPHPGELKIDGCRRAGMILLLTDGTYRLKNVLCHCSSCLLGNFELCESEIQDDIKVEGEVLDCGERNDIITFTNEGSFIALYSSTHFELFYLVKVQKKTLAEENKSDTFGHIVQKGELYLEGVYLEKLEKETSDKVFYKLHNCLRSP